jgi:L-alanine-DL-glutamate epimerase-like enolase superfamily enzyme
MARKHCLLKEEAMKIDAVELTLFEWRDVPPTRYHAGSLNKGGPSNLGLLTIRTDQGIDGHAFLGTATNPADTDAKALIHFLKPVLMGADPLARETLHKALRWRQRNTGLRVIGACDTALWDIAAKAANMPLYQYLGAGRKSVGAYASSQILDSPEAYAEQAVQFRDDGWKAYKIHPPQDPDTDIRVCQAVRAAVGDDYPVMLDSTWSYNYQQALKVGRAIEELKFKWYEDPLNEEDIYSYVKLRNKLDIPILATEYPQGDLGTYGVWVTEQATDMLRGDIPVKGGLSTMIKTAHLAEAFGMTYETHHGGNSHNNAAQLHFVCSLENTTWFEVLLPHENHKYGIVNEIEIDQEGMAHCPDTPGIGAEIDFDLVERMKVAVM